MRLNFTSKIIEELEFENQMMDRYIKKFDIKIELPEEAPASDTNRKRSRSRSRGAVQDRTLKLTAEQKCTIAQVEIEDYKQDMAALKASSEKIIDGYKAIIEEADIQLKEAKKFTYDFEKEVIKASYQERFHAVLAERVMRFLEEHIRGRDTLVEQLRLKNSTLKIQKKKLMAQLRQKEEMGEVLHEVDFEQLKIENSIFLASIDAKNHELLRLKLTAGRTLQVVNAYREKEQVEAATAKLKQLIGDYRVPAAFAYVDCVRNMRTLRRKEKIHERKVAIAKVGEARRPTSERSCWKKA
ncbi:unnamed protein product [Dibothriocephalus latus]|uniref:Cilia- and flagella-associated protein 263 n=1 Tax=Dibothriocephalus latus TaxID=60516 RepID=A0A3P7LAF8_DIBLA|nr:unnamed protein product [Dibothriocephalus latus]